MKNKPSPKPGPASRSWSRWLPAWFKLCAGILLLLICLKIIGLQIFIEFQFNGEPVLAALTEIETYYIPLGLLLVFFLLLWIWDAWFGSRDL